MTFSGFGHGKVILLGEHSVVYGKPALVAAMDKGVRAKLERTDSAGVIVDIVGREPQAEVTGTLDAVLARLLPTFGLKSRNLRLRIETDLPIGAGLGSSAALSVAITRALSQLSESLLDDKMIKQRANLAEEIFHSSPSGVDVAAATLGGVLRFIKGVEPTPVVLDRPLDLVVARVSDSPPTHAMVEGVRARWEAEKAHYETLFGEIGALVDQGEEALTLGRLEQFGQLMSANQERLVEAGVSTYAIDVACRLALDEGALGAKVTGGGGGGCIVCLADRNVDTLVDALRTIAAPVFATTVEPQGFR